MPKKVIFWEKFQSSILPYFDTKTAVHYEFSK